MPLLKKNDTQDAMKREGNTTHIDVFAAPDLGRFFWPGPACTRWRRRSGASAAIKPLLIAANTGDRRKLCDFFRCCCWQCRRRCSSATGCHESGRDTGIFCDGGWQTLIAFAILCQRSGEGVDQAVAAGRNRHMADVDGRVGDVHLAGLACAAALALFAEAALLVR